MKEGSKYQPLLEFLHDSNQDDVTLTFAEIEALMNDSLPDSARSKRAWWSNRGQGALQASAWMEAGYRVEDVDLDSQRVTFRRPTSKPKAQRVGDTALWNSELINDCRSKPLLTSPARIGEVNPAVSVSTPTLQPCNRYAIASTPKPLSSLSDK
jgi:hypothetical protein